MTIKKFEYNGNLYDQSTYIGRFRGFLDVIDPRTLFVSEKKLQESLDLLDRYQKNQLSKDVKDEDLWEALKIKRAIIHPTMNDKIFAPLRMSSFVLMNVPIIAGMLSANSIPATIFWQSVNQTYNSAMNYANRSGASVDTMDIAKSYAIALASSLGISVGFLMLRTKGPAWIQKLTSVPFFIPYVSIAGAGSANVYFTRRPEILNGVPISDEAGNEIGISKEAGKQGVYKTIISRCFGLPLPVLVLPPILMKAVPVTASPTAKLVAELLSITVCLTGALPAAIALYPQRLELDPQTLEKEFHHIKGPIYSNKGL